MTTTIHKQLIIAKDGSIGENPVIEHDDGSIEDLPIPRDDKDAETTETDEPQEDVKYIQQTFGDWEYSETYNLLNSWIDIFSNIDNKYGKWYPDNLFFTTAHSHRVALEFKKLPAKVASKYIPGFTTRGEPYGTIQINTLWLRRPTRELLVALIHGMAKASQYLSNVRIGKPNAKITHNKTFCKSLLCYGLSFSNKGEFLGYDISQDHYHQFQNLLIKNGVECPDFFRYSESSASVKPAVRRENWKAKALELEAQNKELKQQLESVQLAKQDESVQPPRPKKISKEDLRSKILATLKQFGPQTKNQVVTTLHLDRECWAVFKTLSDDCRAEMDAMQQEGLLSVDTRSTMKKFHKYFII